MILTVGNQNNIVAKSLRAKTWMIMKLTIILMLFFTFKVNANTFGQKVTIVRNNIHLSEVFKDIEQQTGVHFFYDKDMIQKTAPIDVTLKDVSLQQALATCLKGQQLTYNIIKNTVVIMQEKTFAPGIKSENAITSRPPVEIHGRVVNKNGEPLENVSVLIKGTKIGTTTNNAGRFILIAPENKNIVLEISIVGYESKSVKLGKETEINVTLEQNITGLNDVVVVGYGTQKKATLTGAISAIKGDKLQVSPSINFTNSLAGRLPGLVAVTRGGEPGNDAATIRIRGSNTLGDNSPLIVIDGIANRSMEHLDPAAIESVTVLKDASAAIYGAEAANGVILITTKRGVVGKPVITINLNQGWSMPTIFPKMTDAATYAQQVNEIFYYKGLSPRYTPEDIQKFKDGSDPWGHPNTNWYKELFKPSAQQRYGNVSLKGGTENLKYYLTLGSNFQDGIYKNSAVNYSQSSFRTNVDAKISNNIHLSFDLAGRQENRNQPAYTGGSSFLYFTLDRMLPVNPAYWPNGLPGPDIERGVNPVVAVTNQTGYDKDVRYIMQGNMKLDITIPWVKGLSITGNYAIDKGFSNEKMWQKPWFLYSWDGRTYDANNIPVLIKAKKGFSEPRLTQNMSEDRQLTVNALINYGFKIAENNNFKVLLGTELIKGNSMNFLAFRRYFISSAVDQMFAGGLEQMNTGGSSANNARLDYFGRLNYNYLNKYIAELVFRYDGSYIFPADKRYGFFPGVSLGWRISQEDFWKNGVPFINELKIRGSWGQTGNDRIQPYQFLSSYALANNYAFNANDVNTLQEVRIPNPNVTWEIANQSNIGVDGEMFDGKIQFSGDYFYNLRTNILWNRNASVPATSGLTLPRENIGEVVNQGFEFQVGYNNKMGDFSYRISVNGAYQKNRIKFWDETPGVPDYQKSTGHPMNSNLYYHAIGIFKDQPAVDKYPHWAGAQPGDVIFEDVNKDGKIDALDLVREYKTDLPTFTGGISLDLGYKNFYASILIQGATGAVRSNFIQFAGLAGDFLFEESNGRWTVDNTTATKPRTRDQSASYWASQPNTYWLRSTDYARLKNVEVGYKFSNVFIKKLGIQDLRIYMSGLNLITLTKLTSFDPESNTNNAYPLNKVYNLGLSLIF